MLDEKNGFRDAARSVRAETRAVLSRMREERASTRTSNEPRWTPSRPRSGQPQGATPAEAKAPKPVTKSAPVGEASARRSPPKRWTPSRGSRSAPAPEPVAPLVEPVAAAPEPAPAVQTPDAAPAPAPAPAAPPRRSRAAAAAATKESAPVAPLAAPAKPGRPAASRITAAVVEATKHRQPARSKPVAPTGAAPRPARARAPSTLKRATPLDMVPLLGPGLRWRLGQLGIDSVETLVAMDEKKLARNLGEIGKMLNLPSWLAAARKVVAQDKK